ncbi:hypothetical protein GE061_002758 [Apolygus lucorum]|uniref:Polycystic kidney disease 2-like 1 protein n=1 Tax=Apolygus lucorum TaxID=248454 RepID=A0A8S9X5Z9_APOLU|nr:hypothetical protein GE061_002758 [Apolygus lucorum]
MSLTTEDDERDSQFKECLDLFDLMSRMFDFEQTHAFIADDVQTRLTSQWCGEHEEITKQSERIQGRIQQSKAPSGKLPQYAIVELTHHEKKKSMAHKMKKSFLQKKDIFEISHERDLHSKSVFQPNRRSTSADYQKKDPTEEDEQINIRSSILEKKGWTTADTIRDEEGYIIFALRDFIIYSIYLVLIWMITFGTYDAAHNYYARIVSDVFTKTDYRSKMGDHIVIDNFSNARAIPQFYALVSIFTSIFDEGRVLFESIQVGPLEVRQLRVNNDTCTTAPMFVDLYETCYDYFREDIAFKERFGPAGFSAWNYTPGTNAHYSYGHVSSYGPGGYKFEFSTDRMYNLAKFTELVKWNWISLGTRAIVMDFALFAPSTNLFLIIKMVFEILPTGGMTTKSYFTTLKLFRYLTPWDLFTLSSNVMFLLFTMYFTFEEAQQVWVLKEEYLANLWNVLDIAVISLSYITSILGINRFLYNLIFLEEELTKFNSIEHPNFDGAILRDFLYAMSSSLLIFACFLKLFKFTSLYKSVTLIMEALGEVVAELLMVLLMTFVMITGFAICALVLFGAHVDHFRNIQTCFFSLIAMFAGNLDFYDESKYAYPTVAPIFFGVYILCTGVIFISLYVALIVYGYHCADVNTQIRPDTVFLSDLLWGCFMEVLHFLRRTMTIKKLKMKKLIYQNEQDYDTFVRILKRRGWKGAELQLFLKSNGLERGEPVDLDHLSEVYNEFCLRNHLFIEVEEHNAIFEQLEKVEKLFEYCDQTIVDIMTKVDYLATQLLLDDGKRKSRVESK